MFKQNAVYVSTKNEVKIWIKECDINFKLELDDKHTIANYVIYSVFQQSDEYTE